MKKLLCIFLTCICLSALTMCGDTDTSSSNPIADADPSPAPGQDELLASGETTTNKETSSSESDADQEKSSELDQTQAPKETVTPEEIPEDTSSLEPECSSEQVTPPPQTSTPASDSAAAISTPKPTPTPTKEPEPSYTYTAFNKIMYAKQSVNVRNLPTTDGKKLGSLSSAQEVTVTGQCNETDWYRINYNGSTAYVSNKYLTNQKPVAETPPPAQSSTNHTNTGSTAPKDNSSSGSSQNSTPAQSGSNSVTVPEKEETGANLVWVPVNGGTKYHSHSSCSNMKDPMQVSVETAIANGYEPCKRCY